VNYTIVGLFVLVLGSALVAGILWIASGGSLQKKYNVYLAIENESVTGLSMNAPVKYNGVEVGRVRGIRLDANNPERVELKFAIEQGTPIRQDTTAVLKTQGLTGIAYVELSGGSINSPPLLAVAPNEYPVIRTIPSLSTRLENVLTSVLEKIDRTSSHIDALLSDKNLEAFSSTLADIATVSRTIAARKSTLDAGMASAAKTFDNTARVTAELSPVIARINRSAEAVERMGNEVSTASASASQSVNAVGSEVQRFTIDALPELQRLLSELNVLSASMRRVVEQTERNPSSLIFGKGVQREGPGEKPNGAASR
jgi:phospholipid/cholesterol/gamma-HCH transport system substrate-binding protein